MILGSPYVMVSHRHHLLLKGIHLSPLLWLDHVFVRYILIEKNDGLLTKNWI